MLKALIACVWLAGSTYGAMAQAASVVFLNPGTSTETFWVSYAQFMQAAAKDLGLQLRVRYGERNPDNTLLQARTKPPPTDRPEGGQEEQRSQPSSQRHHITELSLQHPAIHAKPVSMTGCHRLKGVHE